MKRSNIHSSSDMRVVCIHFQMPNKPILEHWNARPGTKMWPESCFLFPNLIMQCTLSFAVGALQCGATPLTSWFPLEAIKLFLFFYTVCSLFGQIYKINLRICHMNLSFSIYSQVEITLWLTKEGQYVSGKPMTNISYWRMVKDVLDSNHVWITSLSAQRLA